MGGIINKILKELLKDLKNIKPEEIREDLIKLREELIKAGGKPVSRHSSWNIGIRKSSLAGVRSGKTRGIAKDKAGKWVKKDQMMQKKTIHIPKDKEEKPREVIDIIPTEETIDIYVHYPRTYTNDDISVKLDSSDKEQKLHVTTPDTKSTIKIENGRVKEVEEVEWKLNNDTLIISLEKEETSA